MVTNDPRRAEHEQANERARREKALEAGLEDSSPASDPVAAVQPAPSVRARDRGSLQIKRHDKSDVVELSDGSRWRIWPGDLPTTLRWLPTTDLRLLKIEHDFCSHALVNLSDKSRTRVTEASKGWPIEQIRQSLEKG